MGKTSEQSSAVLGVKPAFEDVDVSSFLAFLLTLLKTKSNPAKNFLCSALERHSMEWTLAHPLHDIDDMIELADSVYGSEVEGILNRDRNVFRHRLTVATTEQLFNKSKEFIAVCRDDPYVATRVSSQGLEDINEPGDLFGFCWFDRGGYTTYSNEEISNAKFHHVDLSLPVRTRIRLVNEMIDQHILWAYKNAIPIVCSTSIRADHDGFMKIHKKRGFVVNGSYAWIRTEEAIKCLTK